MTIDTDAIRVCELRISAWPAARTCGMSAPSPSVGVRVEHIPTGIVIVQNSARAQHINRDNAITLMEMALDGVAL